jgi:poly [ADP-ribose] polymerase
LKYNEKVRKGYIDQTHLVAELIVKEKKPKEYKDIPDPSIASIVERLQAMAQQAIRENYTISSSKVTKAMVDEAQVVITNLMSAKDIDLFNRVLVELFTVIPRKMGHVTDYLAKSDKDFPQILQREQDLLDVMRGQVVQHQVTEESDDEEDTKPVTILDALGISFSPTSSDDVTKIREALGNCSSKYYQSWKVQNTKTQARFDKFVSDAGNIPTKLLWHGSRNENWWSIVNSGLILRPTNAIITGKMFGYGIYFATKAQKSLGYTSINGSYWARGNANSAFMSLYDVAYGKPYDVHSFGSYHDMDYEKLQKACSGAHCLHAHEGQMLRNDEIIVYKEDQTTINYLVELR